MPKRRRCRLAAAFHGVAAAALAGQELARLRVKAGREVAKEVAKTSGGKGKGKGGGKGGGGGKGSADGEEGKKAKSLVGGTCRVAAERRRKQGGDGEEKRR